MTEEQARHKILAFFTTLANNKPVESNWAPGARNREHQDIFAVLDNDYTQIICDGPCLTLQINIKHNEKLTMGRAEICDWSINALMTYAQEMAPEEVANLDAPDLEIPSVAKIAQLIDEGKAVINTREYKLEWNGQYAAVRTSKSDDFSGDELITSYK